MYLTQDLIGIFSSGSEGRRRRVWESYQWRTEGVWQSQRRRLTTLE